MPSDKVIFEPVKCVSPVTTKVWKCEFVWHAEPNGVDPSTERCVTVFIKFVDDKFDSVVINEDYEFRLATDSRKYLELCEGILHRIRAIEEDIFNQPKEN